MTSPTSNVRINGDRLWTSLMELARIGGTPKGGVCRLALTDLDRQGRDLVVGWAKQAGMSVTIDKIGNVFMRREGKNPSLPPIACGSHIDTQPTGGKFDGNYGVLAGLEVVRTLNDQSIQTEAPIEVVFWTNEEGSRFVPVMMGSGVFAGAFTLEHVYAAVSYTHLENDIFPTFRQANPTAAAELFAEHEELRKMLGTLGVGVELHTVTHVDAEELVRRLRDHGAREERILYPWLEASGFTVSAA